MKQQNAGIIVQSTSHYDTEQATRFSSHKGIARCLVSFKDFAKSQIPLR